MARASDWLQSMEPWSAYVLVAAGVSLLALALVLSVRRRRPAVAAAKPIEAAAKKPIEAVAKKPIEAAAKKPEAAAKKPVEVAAKKPVEVAAKKPAEAAAKKPVEVAAKKPVEPAAKKSADAKKAEPQRSRKPRATEAEVKPCAVILSAETHAALLSKALTIPSIVAKNAAELLAEVRRKKVSIAFVDVDLLPLLGEQLSTIPVVGIIDQPASSSLGAVVRSLSRFSSLSQVITVSQLDSPQAQAHLKTLIDRLADGPERDLLGVEGVGRMAMLAQASHREARFTRMREYFAKHELSERTITALNDVAEELVMNALYNAPTEAGYFKTPVSRTEDVSLPLERACEISYGLEDGCPFVRVRDTFGALRRNRLIEVLDRCSKTEGVTLDESRGGAGLGIWRVFSTARTIAITVIPGRLTDILVRLSPKPGRAAKQLFAVHLFFVPEQVEELDALMLDQDSSLVDNSITLLQA